MPLSDLIRHFNGVERSSDAMLYVEDGRAAAWANGLRLGSLFRPVADLGSGRIVGHRAGLVARDQAGHPVAFADAYVRAVSAEAVVRFDRLVRTMHALNFLVQRRWSGGWLELAVHSRHLHAVAEGHGLVFEAVLKRCGLGPEDIILAIDGHQPDTCRIWVRRWTTTGGAATGWPWKTSTPRPTLTCLAGCVRNSCICCPTTGVAHCSPPARPPGTRSWATASMTHGISPVPVATVSRWGPASTSAPRNAIACLPMAYVG